jgi:hypothetical protein
MGSRTHEPSLYALLRCTDGFALVRSSATPPRMSHGNDGDDSYDRHGRWVGPNSAAPFRLITPGVAALGRVAVEVAFRLYDEGNYGTGEPGFATYQLAGASVWLVDEAVRTPQGEPPARDVSTSPGPQTLLLPSEY